MNFASELETLIRARYPILYIISNEEMRVQQLVLEIAPGEYDAVEEVVRREMGAAYQLDVPLDVSVGVGPNWHEAAH